MGSLRCHPALSLSLSLPMLLVGVMFVPRIGTAVVPHAMFEWYFVVRAVGMGTALASIFLYARVGSIVRHLWHVRLNLLINIAGLALCSVFILRGVVEMVGVNDMLRMKRR